MIDELIVTNHLDEQLILSLRNPQETGLAIRAVTGLTPPKADVNMTDMATGDGAVFNSAKAQSRNVVIYLSYLEGSNIDEVRRKTYKYFPIKRKIKVEVYSDSDPKYFEGVVESNEAVIFSDKTGAQISIVCPESYMKSVGDHRTIFSDVKPAFSFPFSNESLTEPLIVFGTVTVNEASNIRYQGDGNPGLEINMKSRGIVEHPMFYNSTERKFIKIDTDKLIELTGYPIISGDEIIITTGRGNKRMTLLRGGEYINILNTLTKDSEWLTLNKGDNVFSYVADYGAENVSLTLKYRDLYEGV